MKTQRRPRPTYRHRARAWAAFCAWQARRDTPRPPSAAHPLTPRALRPLRALGAPGFEHSPFRIRAAAPTARVHLLSADQRLLTCPGFMGSSGGSWTRSSAILRRAGPKACPRCLATLPGAT